MITERYSPINLVRQSLIFVGEFSLVLWDAAKRLFTQPREYQETLRQMAFIGVGSVPIVTLTTFASGAVLALYSSELLSEYGVGSLAGAAIGLAVTREIAPVISAIMVAARCGSAMSAHIATMAVTEQVDALRSLDVHPTNYLVIPRLASMVTMLPILCLVGMFAGTLGGYAVSISGDISGGGFMDSLRRFVEPSDIYNGLLKSVIFGLIIGGVACQQGLRAREGAVGVGRATTRAVVISMVLIYVANYFLSSLMYR